MTGLFEALQAAVKRKEQINSKNVKKHLALQLFNKPIVRAMDTGSLENDVMRLQAHLESIKKRSEWRDVALALHIVHTTCISCKFHVEMAEGLLLKQQHTKNASVRYIRTSLEGSHGLPLIQLHRQATVPICHKCAPEPQLVEFQSNCPAQLQFDFAAFIHPAPQAGARTTNPNT